MTSKTKKILAWLMTFLLPLLAMLTFLLKNCILKLSVKFPKCDFYKKTGYLCPACGNTRSVQALLRGQILTSLGYNITPMLFLVLAMAFYTEVVAFLFGKSLRIIPRNYVFLVVLLSCLVIYYIARNFVPLLTLC